MATTTTHDGIITPEAAILEFEIAGIGSRCLARLLDVILLLVIAYVALIGLLVLFFTAPEVGNVAALVVVVVLIVGYPVASETLWNGRTIGKFALGLRVVSAEGAPVRFRHAVLRSLLGIVEVFATLGGVAVLSALCTRRSQRFGDLAAGTIVVRQRDALRRALAVSFPSPAGWEAYVASLDVSTVTPAQHAVIRSYLMRVFELTPAARASLAIRLANPLATQLRHTPPPLMDAELFVACVASAYQRRHGGPLAVNGWSGVPTGAAPPPPPGSLVRR